MGHRGLSLVVGAASCFVLFAGDLAHAQTKAHGAHHAHGAGPAKPHGHGKTKSPTQPSSNAAPAAPASKPVPVCVRPEGVDESAKTWTYDETNKPVVKDVESTAKRVGNRIYVFDEKASLDSPALLPLKHGPLKCPNDDRKPAAPTPKSGGFLPESGPLFASAKPLGPSTPILAPVSLGSSGTGKTSNPLVTQFVQAAAQFKLSGSADEIQATKFATRLREAINNKSRLAEFDDTDLSPNAAAILLGSFGESLAAAMAQQPVIGPLNVLQKMVPSGKNIAWSVFPLMGKDVFDGYDLDSPHAVPAVILPLTEYEQRLQTVKDLIRGKLPSDILLERYKQAYADKPEWLTSISPYF